MPRPSVPHFVWIVTCGACALCGPAIAQTHTPASHSSARTSGWSRLAASPDSRLVYVSSSLGDDASNGLTPETPKQTIAAGFELLRDGFPDWLLLKCGDAWTDPVPTWNKSGRSTSEPMVMLGYGSGERPLLLTGTERGFDLATYPTARAHLVITGIHCWAHTNAGTSTSGGIQVVNSWSDLLIEDCRFDQYSTNIAIEGIETRPHNIRIRRCVINGAISLTGLASGILIGHSDNILIEENLIDHNGWNLSIPGCEPTIFSHNCYVNPDNTTRIVTRGNIVARGSASGLRSSGWLCENNLLLQNPVAIALGPDTRILRNNVILDSRDIDPQDPRGIGMDGTIAPGVQIYGNIIAHQTSGTGNTKAMNLCGDYTDLRVHDNLVYNWVQSVNTAAPALVLDGNPIGAVRVYHNQFQQLSGALIAQFRPVAPLTYTYDSNTYFNTGNSMPFLASPLPLTFQQWLDETGETGAQFSQVSYPNPERTIATYMKWVGGAPSVDEFLALAAMQSRAAWSPEFTAAAVCSYIREGFNHPMVIPCILDMNGNGVFDINDFLLFQSFLATGDPRADLNGDGVVNQADLVVFQSAMGQGCH